MPRILLSALPLAAVACAGPRPSVSAPEPLAAAFDPRRSGGPPQDEDFFEALERERRPRQEVGQLLLQGFVGVGYPESITLEPDIEIDETELDNLPVIGGGGQLKLAGEHIDFGVEALMSFAFRSDLAAFAFGGGGGVVALDVDVFVFDVFGGPYASKLFGDRVRLYAGAGPILSWVEYSQQEEDTAEDEDGDGFGAGVYTRGGIEFLLPSGTLVGFGVRWSSAEVDLGDDFGDFELEGVQALITVTRKG